MGNQENAVKWKGKISTTLTRATADQIWSLFTDFFSLHKWFPSLATSCGVHGNNGEPGCIRYCAGFSVSAPGGSHQGDDVAVGSSVRRWSKERLVSVDPTEMRLRYEIMESNIGFESYEATVTVVSRPSEEGSGCVIDWEFAVDPLEGWVLEDLVKKYEMGLNGMARNMEDYILSMVSI